MARPGKRAARRGTAAGGISARVETLARNLWWSWSRTPQRVFAALDPAEWAATNHDPLETLRRTRPARLAKLEEDAAFLGLVSQAERELKDYLRVRPWFARQHRGSAGRLRVAYFCAEYAIHESLPQYAGGLGVLAGDHLKSASDLGVPLVAVGLLYRCGYYRQSLAADGATQVTYVEQDFERMALRDTRERVEVPLGSRSVKARVWHLQVGRVPLYLLDTDIRANPASLRGITRHLYGGGSEDRIRQEIVLGIGGVRALAEVGERVSVCHLNEGHAAFAALERLRMQRAAGRSLERAIERVRASTVFTTHTPVPAGHDRFEPRLMMKYFAPLAADLGLEREAFLALGREDASRRREPFCMTVLALRLAAHCNGVAKLHGETSRRMWMGIYGARRPGEVPIGHVTNGVHSRTWLAPEADALYQRHLRPKWAGAAPDRDWWAAAGRIPAAALWELRRVLRRRLVHFVRERLVRQEQARGASSADVAAAASAFDENTLTLGFARRFATYKRAVLMFRDPRRLARILNDPKRPMQIVFAGKAHPRDLGGQEFAQNIFRFSRRPEFRGRIALIEEYDMHVGRMLTSGVDVWLNNPLRPQEASGTSGMKPPLHGGLNCSVLDGWWPEAYDGRNGWAIGGGVEFADRRKQDRHDAESLYSLLEQEIGPLFYRRDRHGLPREWLRRCAASMRTVCARFSSHRMLADYVREYYLPAHGQ